MNGAHIALGSCFVVIGGVNLGLARKAGDGRKADNHRLAGVLMMLAGAAFLALGFVSGRS